VGFSDALGLSNVTGIITGGQLSQTLDGREARGRILMNSSRLGAWILVNFFAFGVAMVATLQVAMFVEYGFDFDKHWAPLPPDQSVGAYAARVVGPLVGGLILGSAQACVLRPSLRRVTPWILATAAGFGVVGLMIWPLMAANIWGRIPGPVEPIVGTVGSCSVAGVFQHLLLRRRRAISAKWLALWIVGLLVSLVPTALTLSLLEGPLGLSLAWPVEGFLSACWVAGVAAAISGKALFNALGAPLVADSSPSTV
jgi:hypothetical protein